MFLFHFIVLQTNKFGHFSKAVFKCLLKIQFCNKDNSKYIVFRICVIY